MENHHVLWLNQASIWAMFHNCLKKLPEISPWSSLPWFSLAFPWENLIAPMAKLLWCRRTAACHRQARQVAGHLGRLKMEFGRGICWPSPVHINQTPHKYGPNGMWKFPTKKNMVSWGDQQAWLVMIETFSWFWDMSWRYNRIVVGLWWAFHSHGE